MGDVHMASLNLRLLDFAVKDFAVDSMLRGGSGSVKEPTCQMVAEYLSAYWSGVARANSSAPLMEAFVHLYPALGKMMIWYHCINWKLMLIV